VASAAASSRVAAACPVPSSARCSHADRATRCLHHHAGPLTGFHSMSTRIDPATTSDREHVGDIHLRAFPDSENRRVPLQASATSASPSLRCSL
jgi:hypothetical protein